MSNTEVVDGEVAQDEGPSIYQRIAQQCGIEYDSENYMSVAAYKYEVCNWYQKEFPDDDDFQDPEKVALDIQELINETTTILHENKGARVKAALPVWPGLTDPEDADNKPRRRSRAKSAEGEATEKPPREKKPRPEPKPRGPNRYLRACRALLKNQKLDKDSLSEEVGISPIAAGYCIEAFEAAMTAFRESGHLVGFEEESK
jgi:hypothetical protein